MTTKDEGVMDTLDAILLIEGGDATDDEVVEAFQVLIDDGCVWHMQGFYGRMASRLIDMGLCHRRTAA